MADSTDRSVSLPVYSPRPWVLPSTGEMSMNMTDEDRAFLGALAQLNDACHKFGLDVTEDNLSQGDHVEIALMFLDMADRILKKIIDNPAVVEADTL